MSGSRRSTTSITLAAVVVVTAALASCSPDHAITSPEDPSLTVASGDQQIGFSGYRLDAPLTVTVIGHSGRPRPGVVITWTADGGGSISPDTSVTDDSGKAHAIWTLGPGDGPQSAHASAGRYHRIVYFHATAQSTRGEAPIVVMRLSTPDGSGQSVHPDVVRMPAGWPASWYLLATPYPNGDARVENPSLFGGEGFVWSRPVGVHNPLVEPTTGYLSDPDGVYEPDLHELWVYYRAVDSTNTIRLMRSADGVHFTEPQDVAVAPNHNIVSPTIVRRSQTDWLMWSVNANLGCAAETTFVELRHSIDGVHWGEPKPVQLKQPGYSLWHLDVEWIPSAGEFWAIYNVKTDGSCSTPAVYMATSPDGVKWETYPSPLITRGVIPEFSEIVYRSTLAYDAATDSISFWYSGAHFDSKLYDWRSAYQRRSRSDVFAKIGRVRTGPYANRILGPRPGFPLLMDAP